MAGYSSYGQQFDPNNPNRQNQQQPPTSQPYNPYANASGNLYEQLQQPQAASTPQMYQQKTPYENAQHIDPRSRIEGSSPAPGSYMGNILPVTPWNSGPSPVLAANAQYQQYQPSQHAPSAAALAADDLSAQMGAMSLAPEPATGRKKKKDRHAFHDMSEFQGSSAGDGAPPTFGGHAPILDTGNVNGFQNQFMPQAPAASQSPTPSGIPANGAGGLSPDDLPSVPAMRDTSQKYYNTNSYLSWEQHIPPAASSSFFAHDQGNSTPKFIRLTTNNIPSSSDKLAQTGLPLGLIVQPLILQRPDEGQIPVLDFGPTGPPRCHRCRAYINPCMRFHAAGNNFICNLCNYANDTPPEYYCALTPDGKRTDWLERPELSKGTVEFVVPKEYWTKEPVSLRYLFMLDVSQESINKGVLETFCDGILAALYPKVEELVEGEEDKFRRTVPEGVKVGFMTYDRTIHFYNCSSSLDEAQMLIMPDLKDPFVPLSNGLFVDPYESKSQIYSLLGRLPQMFQSVKEPEPAMLAAINAAIAALETTGGKIIASLSSLPTWGPGNLFLRDDGKTVGGEPDKRLLTTEHPLWKKCVERMVPAGIGADFFLASPNGGYLDIGTVGHVSSLTGGETFYYPNFQFARDCKRMAAEIKHAITRETGYQALMKVRCSNGLQVQAYHGNFIHHTFGADLEIGTIDADKAFGVTFNYDGKLDTKMDAHFQMALLYTTASGQRRVRCCNIVSSITNAGREAFRFADQDAIVTLLTKEAATKLATSGANLKDVRNWITERTIDILAMYRKNCLSQANPPGLLVLPERMREFGIFTLGITKTRAFKPGNESSDRRVNEIRMVRSMGVREMTMYLYPRIIALHKLQPDEGFADPETGYLKMPPGERASFGRLEPGGVYLLDNGQYCYLWFHCQTSPLLLQDLFGENVQSLDQVDPFWSELPVSETLLNAQARNIIAFMSEQRGSKKLFLQIAREKQDGAEFEFARGLVEDRNNDMQSYVDWLVNVHKSVQLELNGHRKREDDSGSTFGGLRPPYWG